MLVLDRDFEVDHFVRESGDAVVEAEAVFACYVCGEDVIALTFFLAVQDQTFVCRLVFYWAPDVVVD